METYESENKVFIPMKQIINTWDTYDAKKTDIIKTEFDKIEDKEKILGITVSKEDWSWGFFKSID
jgi:hypothetical protein